MIPSRCKSILLLLAPWVPAAAQAPPAPAVVTLSAPDVFPEPFSRVRGLRELADGRVLVTDWLEDRLIALDFSAGTQRDLGRVGAGPREFRLPSWLIALPGDTTLLVDEGNGRLSVIGPDLALRGTISPLRALPGVTRVRGADARGRLYLTRSPFAGGPAAEPSDSLTVVRWDRATDAVEEVARIKGSTRPARAGRPRLTPGIPIVPFAPQDGWTVHPDGGVIVVRPSPYRVEWFSGNGAVRRGPPRTYDPLPVTRADKAAYIRTFNTDAPMSGRGPDGGLGHTPSSLSDPDQIDESIRTNEFAELHPPFVASGVWHTPDGEVWVERSGHAGSAITFDRFDAAGRLIGRTVLPRERRLVGFGLGVLYAVFQDGVGFETLERYRR